MRGRTKIAVKGRISDYIPNPTFDRVAAPGAQEEYFKVGNPEGKSRREIMGRAIDAIPAFREPGPRLELMDELGLDRALMWPTLASLVEERLRDDPDATHAVIHALNEWMHEQWTFDYEDRIFPTPVITLPIVERAIEELEWVAERGARIILVRPAPVPGFRGPRSFALPEFDPFWELVQEKDVVVGMHASDSGYQRYVNEWEGVRDDEFTPFAGGGAFAAIVACRVPGHHRHGGLRDRPRALHPLPGPEDRSGRERKRLGTPAARRHGRTPTRSTPTCSRRTRWRCSSATSSCTRSTRTTRWACASVIGVDNVLFGSDFPHPEGMADPLSFVDDLDGLTPEDTAKVMGGNLARLMNVA